MSENREREEKILEESTEKLDASFELRKTSDSTEKTTVTKVKAGSVVGVCPDCGAALRHVEGCQVCNACGYSKC